MNMISRLEEIVEQLEDSKLLHMAENRDNKKTSSFEEFVKEEGFSMEELKKLSEHVEFE